MNLSNELTPDDFQKYLEHLVSIGCVIENWSYSQPEGSWTVQYQFKPTPTPEKIEIDWDEIKKQEIEELDLKVCEQCGEQAWDGRICHSCGAKDI